MRYASPTRTTNPIHFEDLDPKRFEDLVRELIYDFKDWQTIEATGKGGDDDGFDIRAFERVGETVLDDEGAETIHPMDGNLWMVQCKREKVIGPSKLRKILEDVDQSEPPYGYILAAATSFSKTAYDAFRDGLKAKGVMEFYLWGKPELEAQLHQPKNDRILFTFFGISNVSRRRSRMTEIRYGVTNKNRVMRAFGESPEHSKVLVRDSKDTNYPYSERYMDFVERPRWKEYKVVNYHPLGLVLRVRHCYAFYDQDDGVYDLVDSASLIFTDDFNNKHEKSQRELVELARDFWEGLPRRNQAEYFQDKLIRFDSMLVVDDKGDALHKFPHIFVDFEGKDGPFRRGITYLKSGGQNISLDGLTQISNFPKPISKPKYGTIYDSLPLPLPDRFCEQFANFKGDFHTLFDCDGKLDHLQKHDVAFIKFGQKEDQFIQVTHRFEMNVGNLLKEQPQLEWQIKEQIGRQPDLSQHVAVIEFRRTYDWKFRPKKD